MFLVEHDLLEAYIGTRGIRCCMCCMLFAQAGVLQKSPLNSYCSLNAEIPVEMVAYLVCKEHTSVTIDTIVAAATASLGFCLTGQFFRVHAGQ